MSTAEVLTLGHGIDGTVQAGSHIDFTSFGELIASLFQRGNIEADTNHPIIVIIGQLLGKKADLGASKLDALLFTDKKLLLRYFFGQLNVIVVHDSELTPAFVARLNSASQHINSLIANRLSRVEVWTGTASTNIADLLAVVDPFLQSIPTMSHVLHTNTNKSHSTTEHLIHLKNLMVEEIDFQLQLSNHSPAHLSKLSHLVGHWAFPAHELSNDDLVYCVYLMIQYALKQVISTADDHIKQNLCFPTSNELLAFVFMVRDSYKNGNPFHNFRHAVDVLHACFHFLIKLHCLPPFVQLEDDVTADELRYLLNKSATCKHEELTEDTKRTAPGKGNVPLTELQTLGLLIAALGHDVGHPGVTNAFMIKHNAPTSVVYNERSVLELYHTSVFINKILAVNWPSLLTATAGDLNLKDLVITSILATDMAEHFEYLNRLSILNKYSDSTAKVKLLASLLIKCADISNVSRPLRVSSQWAMMLGREFDEVSLLEERIQLNDNKVPKVSYGPVPTLLEDVLKVNPSIHKGQIFFINTFAEKLFANVANLMPELQFACDIIKTNKDFWLSRSQGLQ